MEANEATLGWSSKGDIYKRVNFSEPATLSISNIYLDFISKDKLKQMMGSHTLRVYGTLVFTWAVS